MRQRTGSPAPRRSMSRVWQSLVSIWAWLVLTLCILIWFPIMAVLRLVTAPFDRGRYLVGYFFRKIAVVHAALNPLWRFRRAGIMFPAPPVMIPIRPTRSAPPAINRAPAVEIPSA